MKRITAVLLTILMLFGLTACGKDNNTENSTPEPTNNSSLLAAAEKLKTASSYQFQAISEQSSSEMTVQQIIDCKVAKSANNIATISMQTFNSFSKGGQKNENETLNAYYSDKTGYVQDFNLTPLRTNKIISDTPFSLASILVYEDNFYIGYDEHSILGLFDALETVTTSESDGSVRIEASNITTEKWFELYLLMSNQALEDIPAETYSSIESCSAYGRIDAQGYLTEFCLAAAMTPESNDDGIENMKLQFLISQINAASVTEPDYVKDYALAEGTMVTHLQNGYDAHYEYRYEGLLFVGFGEYYWHSYNVSVYEVLAEIDGVPVVKIVSLANGFGSLTVENLIIPEGVCLELYARDDDLTQDTVLFFKDAEENVEKNFLLPGETDENGYYEYVKAAYYAGEWEYADGVPTPTK